VSVSNRGGVVGMGQD